jgi:UDP-N-acetylmuramoyl-tripeptide--D-alanyl-D-alanine ligase
MHRLKLADGLTWTDGQVIAGPGDDPNLEFAGLSTDTRTIQAGCLYLALHGRQHDGHHYLAQALDAGAGGLLIDDRSALPADMRSCPVILVRDTLQALQDLAAGYRQTLPGRIIGISGSVGKTSTRQMISACLQPLMPVHQTAANQNNEIGLPQTLLQAEPGHEAVILEMGMRGPGEISLLSRIARPDIAVLTCIGYSHIGRLGSQAAILAAKAEIMDGLQPGGLLILNADDPLLLGLGRAQAGRRLAFVTTSPDLAASLVMDGACFCLLADQIQTAAASTGFRASLFTAETNPVSFPVSLPFPGTHHVLNALFGLAVAQEMQADLTLAAAGAAACQTDGNRQRILEAGDILIMDDSYNAGPESMLAALRTLSGLAGSRRKIAALGGMLELGDFAGEAHREVGRQAALNGFDLLLVTGPQSPDLAAGARSVRADLPVHEYSNNLALAEALIPQLRAGDCLLVKGSRGFAMEKVTAAILVSRDTNRLDVSKEGTAR